MRSLLIVILSICIISCGKISFYESYHPLNKAHWILQDTAKFEINIQDTTRLYQINAMIRHYNSYNYQNLWIYQKTTYPDSTYFETKRNLTLGDKMGQWYGVGLNDIVNVEVPMEQNVKFSKQGTYTFEFTHAMRDNKLEDVIDFGIKIKQLKK